MDESFCPLLLFAYACCPLRKLNRHHKNLWVVIDLAASLPMGKYQQCCFVDKSCLEHPIDTLLISEQSKKLYRGARMGWSSRY